LLSLRIDGLPDGRADRHALLAEDFAQLGS